MHFDAISLKIAVASRRRRGRYPAAARLIRRELPLYDFKTTP
jgi:hypothetical protein